MRVVVAGSRSFTDKTFMGLELSRWSGAEDVVIISGAAAGADAFAKDWARELGYRYLEFPAHWRKYGKSAGIIRNRLMIDRSEPDLVMVFYGPDGETPGSKYTETYAREKDIPVEVYFEQSTD